MDRCVFVILKKKRNQNQNHNDVSGKEYGLMKSNTELERLQVRISIRGEGKKIIPQPHSTLFLLVSEWRTQCLVLGPELPMDHP